MKAYIFPGQGAQFTGMGLDLYQNSTRAKELFDKANQTLGFEITKIMFEGTARAAQTNKSNTTSNFLTFSNNCRGYGN